MFLGFMLLFTFNPKPLNENEVKNIQYFKTLNKIQKRERYVSEVQKDLDCMARNIYFEARNQSERGMVAVGQVTMNRVHSKLFPDTVCSVVYQNRKNRYQFSWVKNPGKIRNIKAWVKSYNVAKDVILHGRSIPELNDALFYHAKYVNPNWGYKRVAVIETHIFYKVN